LKVAVDYTESTDYIGAMNNKKHTRKIIREMGGAVAVSKIIGRTSQAVSQWKVIPAEYCILLEAKTGVDRSRQREDLYPVGDYRRL